MFAITFLPIINFLLIKYSVALIVEFINHTIQLFNNQNFIGFI